MYMSRSKQVGISVAVVVIVVFGGYGIYYGTRLDKKPPDDYENTLNPPDVDKPLPPSPSILGKFSKAAVVSNGGPCAEIGANILRKNGSAVEAAIATALCDGVCCMQHMGIGGGFYMTIYDRKKKEAITLNARETAPAAAYEDMYYGDQYLAKYGAKSAAIPGELKGYQEAFDRYKSGNIEWKDLFYPTIELCENGVPVNQHLANKIEFYREKIRISSTLSNLLMRENGTLPKVNDTIKLPSLAKTLRIIADSPRRTDELYSGSLTESFISDIQSNGGIITHEDMANYKVKWSEPITANLTGNLTMFTMPPPGSGPLLAFILQVLSGMIPKVNDETIYYQRIAEAFKHAYGRRTEFGDPSYVNITQLLNELASPDYINNVKNNISDYFTSQDPKYYGAKFDINEDHGTANIVVLGSNGDAVSMTSTINLVFGGLFVSESTGILLNDEMDDFSAPNITNYFGVPPSVANFIKPGKRPMSSMAPSIIVDQKGDVRLVVGSAGGTKITTSIALVTVLNLWFNKNIKEAIDEPRIHHQLMPMTFNYEYGVKRNIIEEIRKIGHQTYRLGMQWRSSVTAIAVENNTVQGSYDFRRPGSVKGF